VTSAIDDNADNAATAEPAAADAVPTDTASTETTDTAPAATEPAVTEPAATEPAETAPVETAPAADAAPAEAGSTEAAPEGVAADSVPTPAPVTTPAPVPVAGGRPVQTVGRRKEAIVRVRLVAGSGKFTLNGRTLEEYFPSKVSQQLVKEPLVSTDRVESFDVQANLKGGGITGQAGALRLAIARALIEVDPDHRPTLKKAGFLTRDDRAVESKKYGLKKARKAPQYSKR
jgi:small subunit ribosomal protein S9